MHINTLGESTHNVVFVFKTLISEIIQGNKKYLKKDFYLKCEVEGKIKR